MSVSVKSNADGTSGEIQISGQSVIDLDAAEGAVVHGNITADTVKITGSPTAPSKITIDVDGSKLSIYKDDLTGYYLEMTGAPAAIGGQIWNSVNSPKASSTYDTTAGSLALANMYGWGSATAATNLTALNAFDNITVSGLYRCSTANVTTVNGPPGAQSGVLTHMNYSVGNKVQMYSNTVTRTGTWTRFYNAPSWSQWYRIMDEGQSLQVTDLDTLSGSTMFGFVDSAVGAPVAGSYDAVGWQIDATGQRTQYVNIATLSGQQLMSRTDDGGGWTAWDSVLFASDKMQSPLDSTPGRIMTVGSFGAGAEQLQDWANSSLGDCTGMPSGKYRTLVTTTDLPPGLGDGIVEFGIRNPTNFQFTQYYISTSGRAAWRASNGGTVSSPTWTNWKEAQSGQDSGWINITLAGGWAVSGGITPQYRKVGSRVYLRGKIQIANANNNTKFWNIPSGYRPTDVTILPATGAAFGVGIAHVYSNNLTEAFANDAVTTSGTSIVVLDNVSWDTQA